MPLTGIRVVDLTRVLAGPYATMLLGDWGADVIKVERPGDGDETRAWGPPWVAGAGGASAYFASVNRNKRSVALDLGAEAGRAVLWRLVETADVVIANFRPGVLEGWGFGWDAVRARNPRAIYVVVNGYGAEGPAARKPAYDLIVQGESGVMDVTGEPGGGPVRVGVTLGDEAAGLFAVQGVLAALRARDRTGRGQRVEVALHDALLALLTYHAQGAWEGVRPRRWGSAHPSIVPYQAFEAADGWITVGVGTPGQWAAFCAALGRPEWAADPRWATNADRVERRDEVVAAVAAVLAARPAAEWVAALAAAGVPCGPIRSVPEALASPEGARMTVEIEGSDGAPFRQLASPVRLEETPATVRRRPPGLGEHTDEVLAEAGFAPAEIAALRAGGVIG